MKRRQALSRTEEAWDAKEGIMRAGREEKGMAGGGGLQRRDDLRPTLRPLCQVAGRCVRVREGVDCWAGTCQAGGRESGAKAKDSLRCQGCNLGLERQAEAGSPEHRCSSVSPAAQSVALPPAALASPASLLERHNLRPHPNLHSNSVLGDSHSSLRSSGAPLVAQRIKNPTECP